MTLGEVIILAATQGLTEFLPVSSSGHLLVVRLLFGISDVNGTALDAFLHLGTVAAVLLYYWRVWWEIVRGRNVRLLGLLTVATLPAAVAGLLFADAVDAYFRSTLALAITFGITAVVLAAPELVAERQTKPRDVGWWDALLIGLAQVAALPPAISRSGVTIAAGRLRGLSQRDAANFSFLMAAPIIAGAALHGLTQLASTRALTGSQLVVGFVVSLVTGLLAIHVCLALLRRYSLWPFSVYLLLLALGLGWYA